MIDKPDNGKPIDPIFVKMDQLLAQMARSIEEVRTALFVIAQIPPEDMLENENKAKRSDLVHRVMAAVVSGRNASLLSGRWHRRDGDAYGIVREPGQPNPEKPHADNPSGDVRSPGQR